MSIMLKLILISIVTIMSSSTEFLKHSALLTLSDLEPISFEAEKEEIINVKCFFLNKFDVYTFEKLQNDNK